MLEIGTLLDGKYKILSKIGQGGMSVVYLAMNEKANKPWAVKEVRKDGVMDFESVHEGLVAETDILKSLSHPNLPSIVDVIDTPVSFIIIMDYIPGEALDRILREDGAQPQEDVIAWGRQLCDVLCYLHSRRPPIIYRDLKPANIMRKPDGSIALIDFGTARAFKEKNREDTVCLGTIGYAAPEQFGGMGQTDARTDIYNLGATLYHLVTGRNPSEPPYAILPIRLMNPSLSAGLEQIILKCTRQNPEDRYSSAAELAYALDHVEAQDQAYRRVLKRKVASVVLLLVLAMVCGTVSLWGAAMAERKKKQDYDYIVACAESYTDYCKAILIDPARTEAYLGTRDHAGLIDTLIGDGVLTASENSIFTQLRAGLDAVDDKGYGKVEDVLGKMERENPAGYKEVCFAMGEACLFYYEIGVERDRYAAAAAWFQYAGAEYPAAGIYCAISDCLRDISKYQQSEQYEKLFLEYQNLWEQIQELNGSIQGVEDDLRLRVWNEIVDMIDRNVAAFCEAVGMDTVNAFLEEMKQSVGAVSKPFLKERVGQLSEKMETVMEKVKAAGEGL